MYQKIQLHDILDTRPMVRCVHVTQWPFIESAVTYLSTWSHLQQNVRKVKKSRKCNILWQLFRSDVDNRGYLVGGPVYPTNQRKRLASGSVLLFWWLWWSEWVSGSSMPRAEWISRTYLGSKRNIVKWLQHVMYYLVSLGEVATESQLKWLQWVRWSRHPSSDDVAIVLSGDMNVSNVGSVRH